MISVRLSTLSKVVFEIMPVGYTNKYQSNLYVMYCINMNILTVLETFETLLDHVDRCSFIVNVSPMFYNFSLRKF